MMEWFTGQTWTVGEPGSDDFCVFGDEESAKWFQERRTVHAMTLGSTPRDDGNFFMTPEERDEVLKKEPALAKFIRRVYGSREFIHNIERYCFWLVDASPKDIKASKILYERVGKVKAFRQLSKREGTQKLADTPHLFAELRQPTTNYLLIPSVSSELRQYVPMGYVSPDVIVTNAAFSLPHTTPYHFGVLTSRVHMAWMRTVCGRLRADYRYSNTIVYNTFLWPKSDPWQVMKIEEAGQKILDVRGKYPDCSFADLYDELTMPADLREAHRNNDAAVMEAYGLPVDMEEGALVRHLLELYGRKTGQITD